MLHRKVLIADDDADIRRLVAHWLEAAGYEVLHAVDGREALETAHRECPHFLITDWDMPGLDGIELCRRIREESFPHYIYTVLLTAHNKVADLVLALETGADDLLTKPIAAPELLARLHAGARVIELENQLVRLARTDPLTGVPNRWVFFEHVARELSRACRHGAPLSCVMCDIDFFKNINDSHGHIVGDIVLKAFAQILDAQCRSSDHLCRYGGEEFCILLTDTGEAAALSWAERIRAMLRDMVLPTGSAPVSITASFGVAELSTGILRPEDLLERADSALRIAKHTGRDRVVAFSQIDEKGHGLSSADGGFRERLCSLTARQIMTTPILTLNQEQPIADAADLFLRTRINSVPVVDECGKLAGIVSEKDLMSAPPRAEGWAAPLHTMMKTHVVCYEETTPAHLIFDFLCRVTIRRVVIVNDGRPTGVISRATLLRAMRNWEITAAGMAGERQQDAEEAQPEYARRQSQRALDAMSDQVRALRRDLNAAAADRAEDVISRVARIQDLGVELLAFAGRWRDATPGLQAAPAAASPACSSPPAEAPPNAIA